MSILTTSTGRSTSPCQLHSCAFTHGFQYIMVCHLAPDLCLKFFFMFTFLCMEESIIYAFKLRFRQQTYSPVRTRCSKSQGIRRNLRVGINNLYIWSLQGPTEADKISLQESICLQNFSSHFKDI